MSKKNKFALATMILIGIGIFFYSIRDISYRTILGELAHLHYGWLAVALICMLLSVLCEGFVVKILLKRQFPTYSLKDALRIPLIAQLFNAITPFSSGGQPAQLVALMQSRVEAGQASSVLLMKFIVYQFMVLVNFLLSMMIGFSQVSKHFGTLSILIMPCSRISRMTISTTTVPWRTTLRLRPFFSAISSRRPGQYSIPTAIPSLRSTPAHEREEK